jgi:UDP-N-acetylmuramoyl-tripeptide--D-alanyl-D-alanine ligase
MGMVVAGLVALAINSSAENALAAIIITFAVILPFYFVLFSGAVLVMYPLDSAVKSNLTKQAQAKLAGMKNLKIIGVAGSYGKTTMKEILRQVLGARFKVQAAPESVNTPVGIARFILEMVTADTEVLVVELGEHYRGDIRELCEIVSPDISVITGINEAHLERMKTVENICATVFEAAEFAKADALVVLNGDDERVVNNYAKYTGGREVRFYGTGRGKADYWVTEQKFDEEKLSWQFKVKSQGEFSLPLLGEYAIGTAVAALAVAEYLGLGVTEVKVGLAGVRPVEHRLQPIQSGGVLVIDDSYNGNPAGTAEAIKVLSRFKDRRKIYITPGLVEIGAAAAEVHREIGRQLAKVADVVILIKDSVTPFIEDGIVEAGEKSSHGGEVKVKILEKPQVLWFDTAPAMHEALKTIIEKGDVVLFQNDWGDQYV